MYLINYSFICFFLFFQPIQVKQEPIEIPNDEEEEGQQVQEPQEQVDDLDIIIQNPTNEQVNINKH